MCGISGIVNLQQAAPPDKALLLAMNNSLSHRGPDADGSYCDQHVALGHRRLSIIDLAAGQQPLFNEDGSVVVVFNGEIYNFQPLAEELAALGHQFKTHSDTEVIVHAWEQWGADCVSRFHGMFAFALWDKNQRRLLMARDRLGKKPLYYTQLANGSLLFASELKALLVHPEVKPVLNDQAIEDYFALGYVPEPKSIFTGIHKLSPGYLLQTQYDQPLAKPQQYWNVRFDRPVSGSETELVDELQQQLKQATAERMLAEVPLGAFLSGGVDSSAVVALMAELSQEPVNTCSIGFDEAGFDESEYARQVAQRYHTQHHSKIVSTSDYDLLDRLVSVYDEPFADSSAIPTYRVCQLAREKVTVALSGDGADEMLAGYRRHRWHMNEERMRSFMPLSLRQAIFGPLGSLYPKLDWAPRVFRGKTTFQALARESSAAYLHTVSITSKAMRQRLFSTAFKLRLQGYGVDDVFRHHAADAQTDDPLQLIQYLDIKTYLPGDILVKVDRASMANSLEVRAPFLDHQLVEWMVNVPATMKISGRNGKAILKKAMEPYLPHDLMYRPKMGFSVPISNWFRGPLKQRVREALLSEVMADSGLFDQHYIKTLLDEHQSGLREHSAVLWSLLMFESFLRQQLNS